MLEREDGLLTRQGTTRALCIVALISTGVGAAAALALIWAFALQDAAVIRLVFVNPCVLVAALALGLGPRGVLFLWRRCDRCRRRLFAEERLGYSHGTIRKPETKAWAKDAWWTASADPERDYRARTVLGSYATAAIFNMALKGKLRCQWCGHEDGVPPSYVLRRS